MEKMQDIMDVARANAFLSALGRDEVLKTGDPLPPFFHQLYFWQVMPPEKLGRDGHPKTGLGLIPDMGLPRRMWAGGRLSFKHPIQAGMHAERRTVLEAATQKNGRTGPLGFVTLRHELFQSDRLCLTEWQDLVYREDPDPAAFKPVPPKARTDETIARVHAFSSTLLFRYSALTFNGHKIHYDRDYARQVEGYDSLVVHGPLLAQYLMLLATEHVGPIGSFSFRAVSPLMDFETAGFCLNGSELWVRGADGRTCMTASFKTKET